MSEKIFQKIYSRKKILSIIGRKDCAKYEKNNYYVALNILFVYEEEIVGIKIKQVNIFKYSSQ